MSFMSANVFDDAQVLRATFQRLLRLVKPLPRGARRQGKAPNHKKVREAKLALRKLRQQLLEKMTPEVLRQVLFYEGSDPSKELCFENILVTNEVLRQAGESISSAKRFAHLLVHVTMMYQPPDGAETRRDLVREGDRCFDMLFLAFLDIEHLVTSSPIVEARASLSPQLTSGFVRQLIQAATRGDKVAFEYLQLFYQALVLWRFDVEPIRADEYSLQHHHVRLHTVAEAQHDRQPGESPLVMPLQCPEQFYPCLKRVREVQRTFLYQEPRWSARNDFRRKIAAIPLEAFDGFLTTMWTYIRGQPAPNLILSGGRDKVVLNVPFYRDCGFVSLSFIRELPTGQNRPFPEIGLYLFVEILCERHVRQLRLDAEGSLHGIEDLQWPPHVTALLWCIIVDAYAEIVVPADRKGGPDDPRSGQLRLLKTHHAEGAKGWVRPHFVKLPEGWRASQHQIEEAIHTYGAPPADGYTFRDEHQRGLPGAALPYHSAQSAWRIHREVKPSLIVTEDHMDLLLEQIATFG